MFICDSLWTIKWRKKLKSKQWMLQQDSIFSFIELSSWHQLSNSCLMIQARSLMGYTIAFRSLWFIHVKRNFNYWQKLDGWEHVFYHIGVMESWWTIYTVFFLFFSSTHTTFGFFSSIYTQSIRKRHGQLCHKISSKCTDIEPWFMPIIKCWLSCFISWSIYRASFVLFSIIRFQ